MIKFVASVALLSLVGFRPPQAQHLSPDDRALTVKLLRETGICHPQDPCVVTMQKILELKAAAETTEQWQPVPAKVMPGAGSGDAPSDAIVLFDGTNLDQWVSANDQLPARWPVRDGVLSVDKGLGNIETKRHFKNYQMHVEWRIPRDVHGTGQERGNSGLFLASTGPGDAGYEIQILDSWNNPTYVNGQAASVYKQSPPLVNASRPAGDWQSYDLVWIAPKFGADGSLMSAASLTLFHNGVLVQDHVRLSGETVFIGKPAYHPYERAAVKLQAHRDPSPSPTPSVDFRNIWIREI